MTVAAALRYWAPRYARIAIGAAFLSAVAGRFGLWTGEVRSESFDRFLARTAEAQALDETAVKGFWSTLDAIWSARDAERFSELFTTDASFTFVDSGLSLNARGPIYDFFVTQFAQQSPELRHETRVRESHTVGPGALAIDAIIVITRSEPEPRSGATVLQTFAAFAVMTRSADQWHIRVLRVYRLPNAPH